MNSYNNPKSSLLNNIEHTINLLEAIRYRNSNCWCFIPSSSEIFAGTEKDLLNEKFLCMSHMDYQSLFYKFQNV